MGHRRSDAVPNAEPWPAERTLAVAARMLEGALDEMTLPQFRVLTFVASAPERAGRIAAMTGVSRPSLTGILDGLVAKGWVRRVEVHDDRRGVTLEITKSGVAALGQAHSCAAARLDTVLDHLPPDERARAVDGLDVLGRAMREHLVARVAERTGEPTR